MSNQFEEILFYKAGKFIKSLKGNPSDTADFSINSSAIIQPNGSNVVDVFVEHEG